MGHQNTLNNFIKYYNGNTFAETTCPKIGELQVKTKTMLLTIL